MPLLFLYNLINLSPGRFLLPIYPVTLYYQNLSPLCSSTPSFPRRAPPTPFPIVIGQTKKGFIFRFLTYLKFSEVKLKFPLVGGGGRNAHKITESRKFLYLLTYLLTLWGRTLLEKLIGSEPVKKFPAFYGSWMFITAFTSARHLSLS
jgi:hypothetical protein